MRSDETGSTPTAASEHRERWVPASCAPCPARCRLPAERPTADLGQLEPVDDGLVGLARTLADAIDAEPDPDTSRFTVGTLAGRLVPVLLELRGERRDGAGDGLDAELAAARRRATRHPAILTARRPVTTTARPPRPPAPRPARTRGSGTSPTSPASSTTTAPGSGTRSWCCRVPRRAGKTTLTLAANLDRMDLVGDARCWYTAQRREDGRQTVPRRMGADARPRSRRLYRLRKSQGSEGVHKRRGSSRLQLFAADRRRAALHERRPRRRRRGVGVRHRHRRSGRGRDPPRPADPAVAPDVDRVRRRHDRVDVVGPLDAPPASSRRPGGRPVRLRRRPHATAATTPADPRRVGRGASDGRASRSTSRCSPTSGTPAAMTPPSSGPT